ncbi:hypothetical protein CRV08_04675 [Halarcobacter ebronensis]|uniref:Uncharacterized protein n=1 Tax=Halarcobacter ebronensis TaxID=1462615 RepID=A0A4Q0YFG1_9BACT|nr:hypothetical protein [Halarcobacter ebronensis]RXJ69307.1 hypothetical protein CRV08_04675 [Halarcobacter ebronensis]
MIYIFIFSALMIVIVIKIEQKIIASKYLIKKAHKYRHKTRTERIERRKEIEEYKKSLTHKYYVDKKLKDPELQKMIDKNKNKSLNAFRFEARLFYYGFFISILFGFFFTITGLYKDEFISSLYPYIEPYFKVFYHNFEKYTFNPLSFKVCFSWIFVFSVILFSIFTVYYIKTPKDKSLNLKNKYSLKDIIINLIICFLGICLSYLFFNDSQPGFYTKRIFYNYIYSYGIYFLLNSFSLIFLFSLLFLTCNNLIINNLNHLKGKLNANKCRK